MEERKMNDRAVIVLEQYDLEVDKLKKGRGTFLFESKSENFLMEEYKGTEDRLKFVSEVLNAASEKGVSNIETFHVNKEGLLLSKDYEQNTYLVKRHFLGKECDLSNKTDCIRAVKALAKLHDDLEGIQKDISIKELPLEREMLKHNRELQKVRKFLKGKSQKSEFELYLLQYYDCYFQQAKEVFEEFQKEKLELFLEEIQRRKWICHGDFQHHNVLMSANQVYIINFERMAIDNPVRDLYQFIRKLLEKNDFKEELYRDLLEGYTSVRTLTESDLCQLKYRFYYPEKFWKIVNFYYNNSKAWMSYKNKEKLEKFLNQEEARQRFLREVLNNKE